MILTFFRHIQYVFCDHLAEATWDELATLLSTHDRRTEKEGPGFSPAEFTANCACGLFNCGKSRGHRRNNNVIKIHALGLDLDKGRDGHTLQLDEAGAILQSLVDRRLQFIAYSTHSYAPPAKACLRVFFALSRPVTIEEWPAFWKAAVTSLDVPTGTGNVNGKPDACSRFWYLPSAPPDGDVFTHAQDGEPLDVDALLGNVKVPAEKPAALPSNTALEKQYPAPSDAIIAAATAAVMKVPHVHATKADYRVACILRRDWALPDEVAWPLFQAWNDAGEEPYPEERLRDVFYRCVDAYATREPGEAREIHELVQTFAPTLQQPLNNPTTEKRLNPQDFPEGSFERDCAQAALDFRAALSNDDGGDSVPKPFFEPAAALFGRKFRETPWLVNDLITEGGLGFLAAEAKSAKTWAATEIALAVSIGGLVFGKFQARKRAVAYFYSEDMDQQVRNRLRAFCAWRGLKPTDVLENLFVQPRGRSFDLTRDEDMALMIASVRRLGREIGLLVLDPFSNLHSGEEDKRDSMSSVLRRLMVLGTVLNCTVLVLHHTHKDGGQSTSKRRPGQKMRGSSAIHGSVDSGLYLTSVDGDNETVFKMHVVSEVKGAKSAGHFDLTLTIKDGVDGTAVHAEWLYEKVSAEQRKERLNEELDTRILDQLRLLHTTGPETLVGRTQLRKQVKGAGGDAGVQAINRLIQSKKLREGKFEWRDETGAIRRTSKDVLYLPDRVLKFTNPVAF